MRDTFLLFLITGTVLSAAIIIFLLATTNNTNEVYGAECLNHFRIDDDVPFCSEVTDCFDDCAILDGGFIKVTRHGGGLSGANSCFCSTETGVQNIW